MLRAYDVLKVIATYHWTAVFKHLSSILGDNLLCATQTEYIWACNTVVENPSDIAASANQERSHEAIRMHSHRRIEYREYLWQLVR
jgi:hypothetical protein